MVYLLALLAALINAVSSVLQRLGVEGVPETSGLVAHMVRRPIWLAGLVLMAGGYVAQAVALHLGSLTVVQPLLVTELVFVVGIMWGWFSMPMRHVDALSALVATLGLGGFLWAADPTDAAVVPPLWAWRWVLVGVAIAMAVLLGASKVGPSWWRALSLGAAASVGFALTAALTKALTDALAVSVTTALTTWSTYAVIVVGGGSFVVMQAAFSAGPFAASQSSLILVNPFVSILIGISLFDERLRTSSSHVVIEVLSLLVLLVGAAGLATSPLVADVHEDAGANLLAGRGRLARWRAKQV